MLRENHMVLYKTPWGKSSGISPSMSEIRTASFSSSTGAKLLCHTVSINYNKKKEFHTSISLTTHLSKDMQNLISQ
ncbi:hypothetical protein LINGRAHAP2_LOCUS24663 [Linum grandiflorum]